MIATKRQTLFTVSILPGRVFAQVSGGEKSGSVTRWWNGGSLTPVVIGGPPETSNIVVTNGFDPDVDAAILQGLKSQINVIRATLTRIYLAGDMTRIPSAKPDVYTDALLVKLTPVETDASSGDVATYALEFAPADLT